jgi:hypothetical protein
MLYYTQHCDTDTTQYVNVDASSGAAVAQIPYYTHHSSTDAPQYVQVDVPS